MRVRHPVLRFAVIALLPLAAAAEAQDGFLFSEPNVQLTLRTGPTLFRADSDLFDDLTTRWTLERSDFRAPALGAELAAHLHPNLDVTLGVAWSSTENHSEDELWEGTDGLPIEQVTRFSVIPLSLSARAYPIARGRSVSSLAWLPARFTPYVGGGVDLTWHRLSMEGEFVDEETLEIFNDELTSSGRSFGGHVRAGFDYWFAPRIGLNVDTRYVMGSATPGNDYIDYDAIDLNGFQAGIGLSLRW